MFLIQYNAQTSIQSVRAYFENFAHTGRELKEMANKLVRIGTLAGMFLRKNADERGEG